MVSQNGLNSLLVTWTPSAGPNVTGYTIFYQQQDGQESGSEDLTKVGKANTDGGESGLADRGETDTNEEESGSVEVQETDTNVIITGLMRGATYNISIMANSNTLSGSVIAGPNQTIGIKTIKPLSFL